MLGFPCGLSCRGLLLLRSLSSSTCSIFLITWRAEHRGWACPGAPHLPLSGWVWAAWPFCHLPSPGASRSPPAPSSSAACPGSASAAQPVAAEPGVGGAAPFLDHSSDGAGGRGERGEEGEQGCPWPRGSTPALSAQSSSALAPGPYVRLPSTFRHSLPSALPLCPPSPGLLESARSANAAPCPSASWCPAHSAAVSASWVLVVVEELAQGGGPAQFKPEYLVGGRWGGQVSLSPGA